jgi:hypothetical protein
VYGAARLSDGRIAVANAGSHEIRLFSSRGAFQRALGREGSGPGEFDFLWALARTADTLIGIDATGRTQVFAPDGQLVRSLPRPYVRQGSSPERGGFLGDGSAVVYATMLEPTTPDDYTWYTVQRQPYAQGDTIELFRLPAHRGGATKRRPLYSPRGVVIAAGQRACAGFMEQYEISCYGPNGRLLFRTRRAVPRRAVTEADRQYLRDAHIAANSPGRRERLEQEAASFVFAEIAPAFGELALATSGELWVSAFHRTVGRSGPGALIAPIEPVKWSVYGLDGRWLADVNLPAWFVPYEMGRDYVIGVTFGADDVERVTMWRIDR